MATSQELRHKLINVIDRSLGGGGIDTHLEPDDYHLAIDKALQTYRQLSENSLEESVMFLDLSENTNTYYLPKEVIEVRQIFRRSVGTPGLGGTEVDPFELAYTNVYILQSGGQAGIATYDFFTIYQEELGKMFGFFLNFIWEPSIHRLQIQRRPLGNETVLLWVYNEKNEESLIDPGSHNRYSYPWIRDWAITECMIMLGHTYRKFSSIPGPAGGTSLPGEQLISEATQKQEELREKIRNFETGEDPAWFVIG